MNNGNYSYERLSMELLAGFYYLIKINIDKGILSNAMFHELELIEQVAFKRHIPLDELYCKGLDEFEKN